MTDRFTPPGRLHVHEHANAARQRAGHRYLRRAEKRDVVPAELARGDGGELAPQVRRDGEDRADDVARANLVALEHLEQHLARGLANGFGPIEVDGRGSANGAHVRGGWSGPA